MFTLTQSHNSLSESTCFNENLNTQSGLRLGVGCTWKQAQSDVDQNDIEDSADHVALLSDAFADDPHSFDLADIYNRY